MGPKDKAKDNEITKKKKDEEKEFTGKDMTIEGTKEATETMKEGADSESKTLNPESTMSPVTMMI